MNRKQKIIVSITGITIVLLALLGLTYAYYLTRIQGNTNTNSISVTTAKLELIYGDNSAEIIKGTGALTPTVDTDEEDAIGTKTFTVTNNGIDSSYVVVIDNVSIKKVSDNTDTTFVSNDFRYKLSCTVKDKSGNTLEDESCNQVTNLDIFPIKGGILVSNNILENKVHEYTLTLWYIDIGVDQSEDMGKSYQARVNIKDMTAVNPYETGVSATDTTSLVYNIINNAKAGKNGTTFVNTPLTTPAVQISSVTSYKTTGEEATYVNSMSSMSSFTGATWYYYDTYVVDETTGKFTLSGRQNCTYINCYSNLVGKYLYNTSVSSNITASNHGANTKTDLSNVYKVTEATSSSLKYVTIFNSPNEAERVLVPTTDDYGTSYYYRGDVEDNYVNFAGMCWRIVRIAGDGSTKLILEDATYECDNASFTGNRNIGSGYYGYTRGAYNDDFGDNIYIINYLNSTTDGMAAAFKTFQTNKLSSYIDKLKSGDWCYDETAYSDQLGTNVLKDMSTYYNEFKTFYYGAYTRIYGNKIASLKCNGTKLSKFSDNTDMYVGTLTADEIAHAGGKGGTSNTNYYLTNQYQQDGNWWWTLSPYCFNGAYDYTFYADYDGSLDGDVGVDAIRSYRPAVNLTSSVMISGGDGTQQNPYVIG